MTPFKTIWPNFVIVYPIDSFQDHLTYFYIVCTIESFQDHMTWFLSLCTQLTPFKTIWPNFRKESIGYTMIKSGQMVLKGVNWVHNTRKTMVWGPKLCLKNQLSFQLKVTQNLQKTWFGLKTMVLMKTMLSKVKSTIFVWKTNWKPRFGQF